MARLHVIYDPSDRVESILPPEIGAKVAQVSLADGLEGRDIYEVARRLAELLLEQIDHKW